MIVTPDTNVLVRLLTRDDEKQYQEAFWLFEQALIYIPVTIILETEWVLRYAYQFKPKEIAAAFRQLFGLRNVDLERALRIKMAVDWYAEGLNFADAIHLAGIDRRGRFATFDQKLIKRANKITDRQISSVKEAAS